MENMPVARTSWRVNKTGALSGLERVSDEIEAPGPGEARVSVRAIGLNFADVFSVLGKLETPRNDKTRTS